MDDEMNDEMTPLEASSLLKAGMKRLSHHDYEAASGLLRQAAEIDPSLCWAWINLGYSDTWLRRFDEAELAFDRAIATAEGDAYRLGWIYRYRGHLWHAEGDRLRALADYEASASQGDDYLYGLGDPEEVLLFAAQIYEELGDYQQAISYIDNYRYNRGAPWHAQHERMRLEALLQAQRGRG